MPTIVTHAIVPLTIASAAGRDRINPPIAMAGALLAMLPDADVLGFRFGIAYADNWGHRGATHSLAIALLLAGLTAALVPASRSRIALAFLFFAAASHGLLDMLTDGGLGVALFWPIETARHFFDWTPIRVSPIGAGFFSSRGLETALSELLWVWLPCAALFAAARMVRARA
ncbi:MAG: metal-dependent hydrolase [Novosphingobium sp.]